MSCPKELIVSKKCNFDISGMTCSACSQHVEKAVSKLDGVNKASVNLVAETMMVEYDDSKLSTDNIVKAVVDAGYGATLHGQSQTVVKAKADSSKRTRLIVSIVFSVLLMYISMGSMIGLPLPAFLSGVNNAVSFALMQLLLSLPVLYVNREVFQVGYKRLFSRAPNMDSLVAVGCTASLAYGVFALFYMSYAIGIGDMDIVHSYYHQLYFESAVMILTLILVGKTLESTSKKRTASALNKLKQLAPKTAVKVVDGKQITVDSATLVVGDIVMVKAGMAVPQDGKVIEGHCFINQSAISGESLAVEKSVGDSVVGGTIVESGYCLVSVHAVGEQSTIAKIIKLVEDANATKPPIARLADKIAGVFVPIVMGIAFVALIVWLSIGYSWDFALSRAVSVLVISCPCALGLATPLAVMVGTGKGAERGILYKSGDALQTLCKVDYVVLDKTGTITEGKPQVVEVKALSVDSTQLVAIVGAIEQLSEHPLAKAIVQYAEQNNIQLKHAEHYNTFVGKGVSGVVDDGQYFVGNWALMTDNGIKASQLDNYLVSVSKVGATPLFVCKDGKLLGYIAVADTIKADSKVAIEMLTQKGVKVAMFTGDNATTAQAIASMVGIDSQNVYSDLLPDQKQQIVAKLKQDNHIVAMVGDGINDAPALTLADVGIAIGCGSDIAVDSADVVLVNNNLQDVAYGISLSRATLTNIEENLFWAFFYNALGIPLACGVLYFTPWQLVLTPMIGALAMSLSSLFVVSNALRLKLFKPKHLKSNKADKRCTITQPNNHHNFRCEVITQANSQSNKQTALQTDNNYNNKGGNNMTVKYTISIDGMMCSHCTGAVTKALQAVDGVKQCTVSLTDKNAVVQANKNLEQQLQQAVEQAGYKVLSVDIAE